jgi:hypothetical protein
MYLTPGTPPIPPPLPLPFFCRRLLLLCGPGFTSIARGNFSFDKRNMLVYYIRTIADRDGPERGPRPVRSQRRKRDPEVRMSQKRGCKNCVYSGPARAGDRTLCLCRNTPEAPGQAVVVPPDGACPHFRPRPVRTAQSEPRASDDPWVRHIPLTQGLYARVDASDYPWLSRHNWCAKHDGHTYYAMRRRHGKVIYMHQEIMLPAEGYVVDHINGHGWDNCRRNMRICTRNQNMRNRAKCTRPCTSPYKGVSRNRKTGQCIARIGYKGEKIYLGTFKTDREAARAYDRAAVLFHGPYARLNFPEEWVTGQWKPVSEDESDK